MTFLRSYFKDILYKFSFISASRRLHIIQWSAVAIIFILITVLWLSGWYKQENVNGIIVEVHGAIFEVLLLSVIFDWFMKTREHQKNSKIISKLHHRLHQYVTACIQEIDNNYILHEKQYVFFGDNIAISRMYNIENYNENNNPLMLAAMHQNIENLRQSHLGAAENLYYGIRQCYGALLNFADKELQELMLEVETAAQNRVKSFALPRTSKPGTQPETLVKDVFQESYSIVYWSTKLKSLLENRADLIESREEHSRKTKERIALLEEKLNLLKIAAQDKPSEKS